MLCNTKPFRLTVLAVIVVAVTGCIDEPTVPGTTSTRNSQQLIIRCNSTDEIWELKCSGTEWTGSVGNCSVNSTISSLSHSAAACRRSSMQYFCHLLTFDCSAFVMNNEKIQNATFRHLLTQFSSLLEHNDVCGNTD
jgi:hypothetical protein